MTLCENISKSKEKRETKVTYWSLSVIFLSLISSEEGVSSCNRCSSRFLFTAHYLQHKPKRLGIRIAVIAMAAVWCGDTHVDFSVIMLRRRRQPRYPGLSAHQFTPFLWLRLMCGQRLCLSAVDTNTILSWLALILHVKFALKANEKEVIICSVLHFTSKSGPLNIHC